MTKWIGNQPPTDQRTGDAWFDGQVLSVWDGDEWVPIVARANFTTSASPVDVGTTEVTILTLQTVGIKTGQRVPLIGWIQFSPPVTATQTEPRIRRGYRGSEGTFRYGRG